MHKSRLTFIASYTLFFTALFGLTAWNAFDDHQLLKSTTPIEGERTKNETSKIPNLAFQTLAGVDLSLATGLTITPTPPGDLMLECDMDVPPAIDLTASSSSCGSLTVSPTEMRTPGNCPNSYSLLRTWTFNIIRCSTLCVVNQTIDVMDATAPTLPTGPANVTVQCASNIPPPVNLTATDNCDGAITVGPSAVITPGACANDFTMVRTWTFTDLCGNSSSVSQTVRVQDNTPPAVPASPANVIVQCASDVPPPVNLTATDNCDGAITVGPSAVITPGACANDFTMVRTWTFTDLCGNSSSVSQTIRVLDNTPPAAPAVPANVLVQCASDVPPPVSLTATDNCDGAITVAPSAVITPGACANDFTMVRTWTFTDLCGNSSSVTQTITVHDDIAPVPPTPPPGVTIDCSQTVPPPVNLTAVDNCQGPITVSPTDISIPGSLSRIRTWSFVDDCGNSSSVSQTITILDSEAPELSGVPADIYIACGSKLPPWDDVSATDNCDGSVPVSRIQKKAGTKCGNEFYERIWTAMDRAGNQSQQKQTIRYIDEDPPVLEVPDDIILNCGDPVPAPSYNSYDACSWNMVDFEEKRTDHNECEYTLVRTWTAIDGCGNSIQKKQTIDVIDQDPPKIEIINPMLKDLEFGGQLDVYSCESPRASKSDIKVIDCCSNVSIEIEEQLLSIGHCDERGYFQKWKCGYNVTDAAGNSSNFYFYVYLRDTTAPVFFNVPQDTTLLCSDTILPLDSFQIYVTDDCSEPDTPVVSEVFYFDPADSSQFALLRTWYAEDDCGNAAETSQWTFTCSFDTTLLNADSTMITSDSTGNNHLSSLKPKNDGGVKIEGIFDQTLTAYPNPARSQITVKFDLPESDLLQLQLVDKLGQILEQKSSIFGKGQHTFAMDLDRYPVGFYSILVIGKNGIRHVNFIKAD